MIKLFDGWVIDADARCYILGKTFLERKKDKKTGEVTEVERVGVQGYYTSLLHALTALSAVLRREAIQTHCHTLETALSAFTEVEKRLYEMLEPLREIERASSLNKGR